MKKILTSLIDTGLLHLLFSGLFVEQIGQKKVIFDLMVGVKPGKWP
jgi:hypothetical protein